MLCIFFSVAMIIHTVVIRHCPFRLTDMIGFLSRLKDNTYIHTNAIFIQFIHTICDVVHNFTISALKNIHRKRVSRLCRHQHVSIHAGMYGASHVNVSDNVVLVDLRQIRVSSDVVDGHVRVCVCRVDNGFHFSSTWK
jgi:hypothetical protein